MISPLIQQPFGQKHFIPFTIAYTEMIKDYCPVGIFHLEKAILVMTDPSQVNGKVISSPILEKNNLYIAHNKYRNDDVNTKNTFRQHLLLSYIKHLKLILSTLHIFHQSRKTEHIALTQHSIIKIEYGKSISDLTMVEKMIENMTRDNFEFMYVLQTIQAIWLRVSKLAGARAMLVNNIIEEFTIYMFFIKIYFESAHE